MTCPAAPPPPAWAPINRWEKAGLWLLALGVLALGVHTEIRGALLRRPQTDVQCYFRAAWALRTGADPYGVTDDNRWHYNYPPLLALVLAPLADPPAGASRAGMLPYAVSVGLWYLVSLACLAAGVHVLARALEDTGPDTAGQPPPAGSRRWWTLRLVPVLACLPAVGASLIRGQVNLVLVALLCLAGAALLRGRSRLGGAALALAACVKIIPAFLFLHPLVRRDWRALAGIALGLAAGLVLLPIAALGPARTLECYRRLNEVLLSPALGSGDDRTRAHELVGMNATESQSIMSVIHANLHYHPDRALRPRDAAPLTRLVHWTVSIALTLGSLAAAGRRGLHQPRPALLLLGLLTLVMLLASPVCHAHYFCLALPLVMALTAHNLESRQADRPGRRLALLLTVYTSLGALSYVPTYPPHDMGLAALACLLLWAAGAVTLVRLRGRGNHEHRSPGAASGTLAAVSPARAA